MRQIENSWNQENWKNESKHGSIFKFEIARCTKHYIYPRYPKRWQKHGLITVGEILRDRWWISERPGDSKDNGLPCY